jgi:hypothetical protein
MPLARISLGEYYHALCFVLGQIELLWNKVGDYRVNTFFLHVCVLDALIS